jgi:hypothetical protein
MRAGRIAMAFAALLLATLAQAADKPCTKADSEKAEKAVDRVVTWPQLQKAWQDYAHCDTGEVSELYTDALLRLLVPWKDVEILATGMKNDEKFRDFVYAHLKSPAAKDDRSTVFARAKTACPKGQDEFCAGLVEVVKAQ